MKIAVVVTLFGNYDTLKPIPAEFRDEAYYFLITDCVTESADYVIIPVDSTGKNLRRLSRDYKIRPFDHVPGFDYYIYLDASIELLTSPRRLVKKYLADHDIAVLKHPWRDCVYTEMRECIRIGITDWDVTHEQARYYRAMRYPENNGLTENGIIIRRNNKIIREFSEFWYFIYQSFAERDQFSFCYSAWRMNVRYNLIPNNIRDRTPGLIKEFNFKDHPR